MDFSSQNYFMKRIIALCIMVLVTVQAFSQDTKKRERKNKSSKEVSIIEDIRPDDRTSYFIENVLPTNDTTKIIQFIASGISVNAKAGEASSTRFYQTVLTRAIHICNITTVECLLRQGADPNLRIKRTLTQMFSGNTSADYSMYPLEAAAQENDVNKMDLLVRYGADMSKCLDDLKKIAANKGNTKMMEYISEKTGKVAVELNALAVMTEHSFEHDASLVTPELIEKMVSQGADVNAYSPQGRTALINVIKNNDIRNKPALVKALLNKGANPNKSDIDNPTRVGAMKFYSTSPLKAAVRTNNLEVVKLLVENGADVNQSNGGDTPLGASKLNAISEYLILKGAK